MPFCLCSAMDINTRIYKVNELNRKKTLFVLSAFLIYVFQANGPNDFFFREKNNSYLRRPNQSLSYEDEKKKKKRELRVLKRRGFSSKNKAPIKLVVSQAPFR